MNQAKHSPRFLLATVFVAGMCTLAIEFITSRMLQTVYGTSNLVWANVIGLVLFFLTMGYFIGGQWADKRPFPHVFYGLVSLAGFATVSCLLLTSALLRTAAAALATINVNALLGSFVGVVIALAIPMTLLGCLSPFAIRLAIQDVGEAGKMSGRIYAISTWGSLLGTYLPTLYIIPEWGTRAAVILFGFLLLLMGIIGLWQIEPRRGGITAVAGLLLLPLVAVWGFGPLKNDDSQIFEKESAYNYIQVTRHDDCNYLLLNEGQAYHSFYCDGGRVPVISVWSVMLTAPYFNAGPVVVEDVAMIGLAAGTMAKQYSQVYDSVPIEGIELDPAIVQAGRDYFGLNEPNIHVIIGDGRYELNRLNGRYSVITIDAYKVPYIPWHLTTQEFFSQVKAHLRDNGVVTINVGRAPQDRRLVDALTATLLTVFPTVHAMDVPGSLNTILVATVLPTSADNLRQNIAALPQGSSPLLEQALAVAVANLVPIAPSDVVFTDERAPVETIIDSLVLRYLLQEGPSGLPGLGN